MKDIKPRINDDGVPWCDDCVECPQRPSQIYDFEDSSKYGYHCLVDGDLVLDESVCPHAVRRMAVENEAWRGDRLHYHALGKKWYLSNARGMCSTYFDTIEAAVDALMGELNA